MMVRGGQPEGVLWGGAPASIVGGTCPALRSARPPSLCRQLPPETDHPMDRDLTPPNGSERAPVVHTAHAFELLQGHIDDVLREWRLLVQREPWAPASPARLINSLPEMLPKLFRLAERGALEMDLELSEMIAQEHGFFRRDDGLPLSALAEEWNHLKRACWKVLQSHEVDPRATAAAMQRLDTLIDDAIGFSLRGFYAPELDELRGRGLERRRDGGDRRQQTGDRRSADRRQ